MEKENEYACQLIKKSNALKIFMKAKQQYQKYVNSGRYDLDNIQEIIDNLVGVSSNWRDGSNQELMALINKEIAKIYYESFKDLLRTEKYCKISIELLSKVIRRGNIENCYIWCNSTLKDINKIREKEKIELDLKLKEKIILELESIFNKLNSIKTTLSIEEFIKYVIKNHPPSNNVKFELEKLISEKGKRKTLIKLITLYHPDKFSFATREEKKKKILMEEISKILNEFKNSIDK
jgi:hypothetical protein